MLFRYVNQGPDPADRSTQLEGYSVYMNDSNSQNSNQVIFMKYWGRGLMKLNNSQYKSSDIESKVFISLFYAPLNGQSIPCNNLE